MCLRDQVIYDENDGISEGRWALRLSNNNGGFGGGRGIDDASKGLETTTEAAGARQQDRGIYNNNGGVGRGR